MSFSFPMRRALVLACSGIFFYMPFFAFGAVSGDAVINEVMYDLKGADDKHEWVELYNASAYDIDIAGWKFNDGSNHLLNVPPKNGGQGAMIMPSGGYAVLADDAATFLSDHPGFSGTVIDTAFSLKNTEVTLTFLDKDGVSIDSISYQKDLGGAGNGMTLERISAPANWKESAHEGGTPGASNSGVIIIPAAETAPPAVPAPSPAPIPQAPTEQVTAPVSDGVAAETASATDTHQQAVVAVEMPVVVQAETASSEAAASSAPIKVQTAKEVAKKEDIGENDASAVQQEPRNENTRKGVSQPALASRAFGYNIYILIAASCGLLLWLSFRRRPAPVMQEEQDEQ